MCLLIPRRVTRLQFRLHSLFTTVTRSYIFFFPSYGLSYIAPYILSYILPSFFFSLSCLVSHVHHARSPGLLTTFPQSLSPTPFLYYIGPLHVPTFLPLLRIPTLSLLFRSPIPPPPPPLISSLILYLAILLYLSSFHPDFKNFGIPSTLISLYHLLLSDRSILSRLSLSCSFLSSFSILSYPCSSSSAFSSFLPCALIPLSFIIPLPFSQLDIYFSPSFSLSFISFKHSLAISRPSTFPHNSTLFCLPLSQSCPFLPFPSPYILVISSPLLIPIVYIFPASLLCLFFPPIPIFPPRTLSLSRLMCRIATFFFSNSSQISFSLFPIPVS